MARLTVTMMISLIVISMQFLASMASPVLSTRQLDQLPELEEAYFLKPNKTDHLSPQLRANATRERYFFGPLRLLGKKDRETAESVAAGWRLTQEGMVFERRISGFCNDCMVLAAKADLHFLNGTRATISHGVYNHHLLVLDGGKRTLPWYLCPGQFGLGSSPAAGFMITGVAEATNWYSPPESKIKAGYWIGKQQTDFLLNAELVSYNDESMDLYVTTDVEYVKGWPEGHLDASMSLHSVTGCGFPSFMVPTDEQVYNLTSPKTEILREGYIVASTGHVHDGGRNIYMTINDKMACDSKAVYGGDGNSAKAPDGRIWETIRSMTECNEPIPIKKGDLLETTAIYDIGAHALRHSATGHGDGDSMGTMFVNFAFEKEQSAEQVVERTRRTSLG